MGLPYLYFQSLLRSSFLWDYQNKTEIKKVSEALKQRGQITYLKTFIPNPIPAHHSLKMGVLSPQHQQGMDM